VFDSIDTDYLDESVYRPLPLLSLIPVMRIVVTKTIFSWTILISIFYPSVLHVFVVFRGFPFFFSAWAVLPGFTSVFFNLRSNDRMFNLRERACFFRPFESAFFSLFLSGGAGFDFSSARLLSSSRLSDEPSLL